MKPVLIHPTAHGEAVIACSRDGRFHAMWKGESLGSYQSAVAAIDDMAGGHTFSPSDGTELDEIGLSRDIGDWLPAPRDR